MGIRIEWRTRLDSEAEIFRGFTARAFLCSSFCLDIARRFTGPFFFCWTARDRTTTMEEMDGRD